MRTRSANMVVHHLKDHTMTDPRNVAHDKKVQQEKKHRDEEIAPGAEKTPQPGKKPAMEHHASDIAKVPDEAAPVPSEEKPLR
jgi:hypothetical protein